MTVGKTAKTKKAIVALTEDSKDIEIFGGTVRNRAPEDERLRAMVRYDSQNYCVKGAEKWELKPIIHILRPEDI